MNDLHGCAAGDRVLKLAAPRTLNAVRASDIMARMAATNSACWVIDADLARARQTGERLVQAVAQPYHAPAINGSR